MRRAWLALSFAVSGACAAALGPVSTQPTPEQVQAVRVAAIRAADVTTTALGILDETGKLVATLPISTAQKNAYDCAIVRAVGLPTPASPAVTAACGAVPLTANAPLPVALRSLQGVSACPSLRASLVAVYGWVTPLIQMLEQSDQPALRMAGASLRVTIGLLASGGVTCG